MTGTYPLHRAALLIAIADHRPHYDVVGIDSDDCILHAIIARHLYIASECPADKLGQLYDLWNTQIEQHPLHSLALCRVLEILEPILEMTGDTVAPAPASALTVA